MSQDAASVPADAREKREHDDGSAHLGWTEVVEHRGAGRADAADAGVVNTAEKSNAGVVYALSLLYLYYS